MLRLVGLDVKSASLSGDADWTQRPCKPPRYRQRGSVTVALRFRTSKGPRDAQSLTLGKRFPLLLEEGVGEEFCHLDQMAGVEVAEGGAGLLLESLEPGSFFFQFIPALRPSRKAVEVVIPQLLGVQLLDGEVVEGVQH